MRRPKYTVEIERGLHLLAFRLSNGSPPTADWGPAQERQVQKARDYVSSLRDWRLDVQRRRRCQ